MNNLQQYPRVLAAADSYLARQQHLLDLCIQIQQIPAPTGFEATRARRVADYFHELNVVDIEQDELFNVYARVPGRENGPALLVSAHTDTVFPASTDLTVRMDDQNGYVYGPGIGDNSTGVAGLVALAETLSTLEPPPVDIWLVANSGEEGLGDLRGMRAVVERLQSKLGACIVLEGMGLGRIVHQALGSRRFRIAATAPGGHSWSDFGTASAIHVLVRLAAELTRLAVPQSPRTTFNVGRIYGGTSVNTIAHSATLELDLRSEDLAALEAVIVQVQSIVAGYRAEKWRRQGVTVTMKTIGDRPTGGIPADHALVRAADWALTRSGVVSMKKLRMSSTDANIPLSRGLPAVCVGITEGGDAHRLSEWINPRLLPRGMKHLLLLTWWAATWLAGEDNAAAHAS